MLACVCVCVHICTHASLLYVRVCFLVAAQGMFSFPCISALVLLLSTAPNARTPRNCCLCEVYVKMIWRYCHVTCACTHAPQCSWWHTCDDFIFAPRCVCGARSLHLKYLKHICMYDLTVSWSACAELAARWCVLNLRKSALCAHMCGATLILCVINLYLKLMLHGLTAMMAYMCSVPRNYGLVSAAAPLPRSSQLQHD